MVSNKQVFDNIGQDFEWILLPYSSMEQYLDIVFINPFKFKKDIHSYQDMWSPRVDQILKEPLS